MEKTYLGFIAYSIKNFGGTKSQWRDMLTDDLKVKSVDVSSKILKEATLRIYYAHFVAGNVCMGIDSILETGKSASDLKDILTEFSKLRKKSGLPELQIVHYTDTDKVITHMKQFQGSVNIVSDLLKIKSPKKTKAVSRPKHSEKHVVKKYRTDPALGKEVAKSMNKAKIPKSKIVYTVVQLKEMAKKKGLKGYSKMNKEDLKKALNVK